jgi:hypothetical protein
MRYFKCFREATQCLASVAHLIQAQGSSISTLDCAPFNDVIVYEAGFSVVAMTKQVLHEKQS